MSNDTSVFAPWTPAQVKNLTDWQQNPRTHPFTCGVGDCRTTLVAYEHGWHCPKCGRWKQNWAPDFAINCADNAKIGILIGAPIIEDTLTYNQALMLERLWQSCSQKCREECEIEFPESRPMIEKALGRPLEIA